MTDLPPPKLPPGYTLRTIGDEEDVEIAKEVLEERLFCTLVAAACEFGDANGIVRECPDFEFIGLGVGLEPVEHRPQELGVAVHAQQVHFAGRDQPRPTLFAPDSGLIPGLPAPPGEVANVRLDSRATSSPGFLGDPLQAAKFGHAPVVKHLRFRRER